MFESVFSFFFIYAFQLKLMANFEMYVNKLKI
jgi:hypothetical protein